MTFRELYIDGKLADLPAGGLVELTYQVNDLADLKDRQSNYSRPINLPKTALNRSIFGFGDELQSTSEKPYRRLPCKYVEDGVDIVPAGCIIAYDGGKTFDCRIYSGTVDLFDVIKGKKISDIQQNTFNHIWETASFQLFMDGGDQLVYPVMDTGGINPSAPEIDVMHAHPGVYLPYLVKRICEDAGFEPVGKLFDNERFKRMTVPVLNNGIDDSYLGATASLNASVFFNALTFGGPMVFHNEVDSITTIPGFSGTGNVGYESFWRYDGLLHEDSPLWRFAPYAWGNYKLKWRLRVQTFTAGAAFTIRVRKRGRADIAVSTVKSIPYTLTGTMDEWVDIDYDFDGAPGDKIFMDIVITGTEDVHVHMDSTFTATGENGIIEYGKWRQVMRNLPNMLQSDLLKAVGQIFGVCFNVNAVTGTVRFWQMNELEDNKIKARNWTNKIQHKDAGVVYRDSGYGQRNVLRWAEDNLKGTAGKPYHGTITIDDEALEPLKDPYLTLSFAATDTTLAVCASQGARIPKYDFSNGEGRHWYWMNSETYNVDDVVIYKGRKYKCKLQNNNLPPDMEAIYDGSDYLYALNYWEDLGSVAKDIKPRLIITNVTPRNGFALQQPVGSNVTIPDGTAMTQTWFAYPGFAYGLDWPALLEDEQDVLVRMLHRFKLWRPQANLSQLDINELDHSIPVYDETTAKYYYVNKIDPYAAWLLSDVELIKLA